MILPTIAQAKNDAKAEGIDDVDIDALLCFTLNKNRTYLYTWPEAQLSADQTATFNHLITRRKRGEPVAYLTGVREFWSLPIKTNSSTLIPRPDTEVLIETVLQHCTLPGQRCLDLGTGTGAIALAIKSEKPDWTVEGVDRVANAVALARENALTLQLDVAFRQGNWCEGLLPNSIDVLVSNPPYIDKADPHLQQGDVRFEPISALIADDDGLSDIKIIIQQAWRCLSANGYLFIEHGWQQGAAVRALLKREGFTSVETVRDYAGNERVSFAKKTHTDNVL